MTLFLTEKDKKMIYDLLAKSFISALQKTYIGKREQKYIAQKILNSIEKAQTLEEVIEFLRKICQPYSFFKEVLVILEYKKNRQKEKEIMEKLSRYIKENDFIN